MNHENKSIGLSRGLILRVPLATAAPWSIILFFQEPLATKWETPRGILPGSISCLSEGIGEVALDRENIAAIARPKEAYRRFALGRPLPARSDTNSHGFGLARGMHCMGAEPV